MENSRRNFITGLHELADFLEENEEVALPNSSITIYSFGETENLDLVRKYARTFGTFEREEPTDISGFTSKFILKKAFSGGVYLRASFYRSSVCEKVSVQKMMTVDEWVCPQSLLAEGGRNGNHILTIFRVTTTPEKSVFYDVIG